MAGGGQHGKQLARHKNGGHQLHILQVAATQVGVVHDPDVAIFEAALRIGQPNDVLHAELHVGQKHRQTVAALGNGLARGRVKDAVGTVVGLRDDGRDGRVDEVQIHLIGNLFEAAAHNGQGDWVHGHFTFTSRLPCTSTVAVMSGSMTVVVSLCSTMAGPSKTMPGAKASRV